RHADLLKNVSDAIKAFQDDLKYLQIEDRVMGMTFSEFGRRIKSNSSVGTDHGAAAPLIVFGTNAIKMVHGKNPDIPASATVNDNIPMQYDFRSVYASMLQDWLCVKPEDIQQILLKNFQTIPLIKTSACTPTVPNDSGKSLISNYPNPFTDSTTITFTTNGGHTLIQIMNTLGQLIDTPLDQTYPTAGTFTIPWSGAKLRSGIYYCRLQNGNVQQVKGMLKVR
ncbi:MAG: T9SS type A sorting domain-containing protein, partial [Ginsengibacter sp.]